MRRAVFAVTGLAASTTLLVVLKGGPSPAPVAQNVPAGRNGGSDAGAVAAAPPTPRQPGRSAPPPRAGKPTPAPADTAPVTATGPVVTNQYGRVQVRVTMLRGRISDVTAVELPQETAESSRRSERVDAAYSGPAGQVVGRQSAELDTVSGATATSESYRNSLAAAIDAAAGGRRG
ncbi:FMN-binding domain-containing protein [Micromonospora pattaloongensis]|uniref:FMN-binding domain-containing protein n=1 Tax=Micromonospora pattaloongensis TaxID=405436 RepID=A0A1H3PVX4_9ACTN|nr:FMN-binding protein [Micromonospora pattaloongensis]SDZ04559.1 FMN-binding domain-containing protein [Micromonospora pattaloongensis]